MTSRAQRLTLMIGGVVLAAAIAGVLLAPVTVAAPKKDHPGKGKPPKNEPQPGAFVIEVNEEGVCCGYLGTFVATGAIDDAGIAGESWCDPRNEVGLRGALGNMVFVISGDTFEIVEADGAYTDLVGVTGSHYTPDHEPTSWVYRKFEGSVPE